MAKTLNQKNFNLEVLDYKGKVLVDFWAPWCGPCLMLGPTIDELSQELKGKVKVAKLNVDDNPDLAQKYDAATIPTVIVFDQGKIKHRLVGVRIKKDYLDAVS